jgi:hypothetical protein
MAKTTMVCPFSNKLCIDCEIYRGRHYYLSLCEQYRGYLGKTKGNVKSRAFQDSYNLEAFKKWVAPWFGKRNPENELQIRLKVIDMESEETRVCTLEETKTWDWTDPVIMRFIDGIQVTDRDKLIELLTYKAKKGFTEVELYKGPRFMLLGGG